MYSDDSAASEIASDDENHLADSGVASEIEESGGGGKPAKPPPPPVAKAAAASDAYEDEDYEDYDDGYSVDFEEDAASASAPSTPKRATAANSPIAHSQLSPTKRPAAISDDKEDYEASFEDESRKSNASVSQSARLVVDLSIPNAKGSPTRTGAGGGSKPLSPYQNPNSPHVDLKVLSKPTAASVPPAVPQSYPQTQAPPQYWYAPPPPSHELAEGEEKKFSLLLRKVESKFEDEIEELREKNSLLQWKERELKAGLRMHRDELKMRKARMDKKRKRALERRREHDRMVDRLHAELRDAATQNEHLMELNRKLEAEQAHLSGVLTGVEAEKREVEERNLALAEKLQATLSDFHALNLRFEETVNAKILAEKRVDDVVSQHRVELQVLEHKCRLECESLQRALEKETTSRESERVSLPENHRLILEAEKDRYEKLEAALVKQMRELETQAARDALKHEGVVAQAWEMRKLAEDKAEKRVQTELQAVRAFSPFIPFIHPSIWRAGFMATWVHLNMDHSFASDSPLFMPVGVIIIIL